MMGGALGLSAVLSGVLSLVAAVGGSAIPFKRCDYSHKFGVEKVVILPDPPRAGELLHVTYTTNPPKPYFYTSGSIQQDVSVEGIVLESLKYDLCKAGHCPVLNKPQDWKISYTPPSAVSGKNLNFTTYFLNEVGVKRDCISFGVTPSGENATTT